MIVLVFNIILAMLLLFRLMHAKQAGIERGTNVVTKFVRDSSANATYNYVSVSALLATIICLVLSLFTKYKFVACFPTAAVCIACFVFKAQSNKNTERVKAVRQVTKNSLEVGAAAGSTAGKAVGGVVGAHLGGVAGSKVGYEAGAAIGDSIGDVSRKCADAMSDCDSINVSKEDFRATDAYLEKEIEKFNNPELFMKKAKALGMVNEGDDVVTVAERIMSYAPAAALQALPDNATLEDKAMLLLEGKV